MRSRYCRACQGLHDLAEPWPRACYDHFQTSGPRSDLAFPMVLRDGLDDVINPINGQPYDSKRAYERDVKAAGCVIMGNDAPTSAKSPIVDTPGIERDIKDAIEQINARSI